MALTKKKKKKTALKIAKSIHMSEKFVSVP